MNDHETTLREHGRVLADAAALLDRMEIADPDVGYSETAKLRRKESAACLAGADALRRGTCANCDHRIDWLDAIGCNNARGLGRDEVSPDDFCSEWAPRRPRPTEPTR